MTEMKMEKTEIWIVQILISDFTKSHNKDKSLNYQVELFCSELFDGIPTYSFATLEEANKHVNLLNEVYHGKIHRSEKFCWYKLSRDPEKRKKIKEPTKFLCSCKNTYYIPGSTISLDIVDYQKYWLYLDLCTHEESTQKKCLDALESLQPILEQHRVRLIKTSKIGVISVNQGYEYDGYAVNAYLKIAEIIIQHFKEAGLLFEPRIFQTESNKVAKPSDNYSPPSHIVESLKNTKQPATIEHNVIPGGNYTPSPRIAELLNKTKSPIIQPNKVADSDSKESFFTRLKKWWRGVS